MQKNGGERKKLKKKWEVGENSIHGQFSSRESGIVTGLSLLVSLLLVLSSPRSLLVLLRNKRRIPNLFRGIKGTKGG